MSATEQKKINWVDIANCSDEDDDEQPSQQSSYNNTTTTAPVKTNSNNSSQPQQQYQPQQNYESSRPSNNNNSRSSYQSNSHSSHGGYEQRNEERRGGNQREEFSQSSEDLQREIESSSNDIITFKVSRGTQQVNEMLIKDTFQGFDIVEIYSAGSFFKVKFTRESALEVVKKNVKDYPFLMRIWVEQQGQSGRNKPAKNNNYNGSSGNNYNNHSNNSQASYTSKDMMSAKIPDPILPSESGEGFSYVMNSKRGVVEGGKADQFNRQSKPSGAFDQGRDSRNGRKQGGNDQYQDDGIVISRNSENKQVKSINPVATPNQQQQRPPQNTSNNNSSIRPVFLNSQKEASNTTVTTTFQRSEVKAESTITSQSEKLLITKNDTEVNQLIVVPLKAINEYNGEQNTVETPSQVEKKLESIDQTKRQEESADYQQKTKRKTAGGQQQDKYVYERKNNSTNNNNNNGEKISSTTSTNQKPYTQQKKQPQQQVASKNQQQQQAAVVALQKDSKKAVQSKSKNVFDQLSDSDSDGSNE